MSKDLDKTISLAEKKYIALSQDALLIAAMASFDSPTKRVSFEQLVAQCFKLFPKKFELQGYPQWPNAVIINKAWLRCRSGKKLVHGNVAEGFYLTPKGIVVAEKVRKQLGTQQDENKFVKDSGRKADKQTASGRVVNDVEQSSAYKKFLKSQSVDEISEHDASEVLYAMIESGPEVLQQNFEAVRQHLENYGREDLISFLRQLREKFIERFTSEPHRGGMLPQDKKRDN